MSLNRMKLAATIFLVILLTIVCLPGFSQKVSQKKDISIFKLSYYKYTIPDEALGSIDEQLKSVFINLGRFNILGMTYRLADDDINQFIAKIKEYKQANTEISESFKMGYEVFTEKDLNQLVGSFIVVIPTVAFFNTTYDKKTKNYETTIKTSFTFVDVEKGITTNQFFVEGTGSAEDKLNSMQKAVESIPVMLEYEITKIFTLETGILEVKGGEVVIQLGKDMGIKPGYEFEIVENKILSSGVKMESSDGLLIVKDVQQEVSFGNVIFGDAQEGAQLKEIPRQGFEASGYFNVLYDVLGDKTIYPILGLKVVAAKGFYGFRPVFGIEVPTVGIGSPDSNYFALPLLWVIGVPFNTYIGCQIPLYLGRLVVAPEFALGAGWLVPHDENARNDPENKYFTHFGGYVSANISYFITRDIKITADLGYKTWLAPTDLILTAFLKGGNFHFSYGGLMIGGGITAKL